MIRFVIFCRLKSAELTGNWPFSITLTRTRQAVHVIESIDIDTATALVYMQSPDAHEKFLEITTAYDVRATKLVSLHSWKHSCLHHENVYVYKPILHSLSKTHILRQVHEFCKLCISIPCHVPTGNVSGYCVVEVRLSNVNTCVC